MTVHLAAYGRGPTIGLWMRFLLFSAGLCGALGRGRSILVKDGLHAL